MRRLSLVLFLALLAPSAGLHAEEPATAPLHTWNQVWKPGDVMTMHHEEDRRTAFVITQGDAEMSTATTQKVLGHHHVSFTLVTKCLEADAQGRLAKFLVHVRDWSQTEAQGANEEELAAEPDTSLTGAHVEVTRTAKAHEHKLLTPGLTLTPGAKAWLDEELGAGAKDAKGVNFDQLGRPAGPVKVGDSWTGDPAKLDLPFAFDPKRSGTKLSLEALEGDVFTVPVQVTLQLTEFSLGDAGPKLPFTEGGTMKMDMKVKQSMAPGTFDGAATLKMELEGTASEAGKLSVALGIQIEMTGESSTGGEMPPAPAAK